MQRCQIDTWIDYTNDFIFSSKVFSLFAALNICAKNVRNIDNLNRIFETGFLLYEIVRLQHELSHRSIRYCQNERKFTFRHSRHVPK